MASGRKECQGFGQGPRTSEDRSLCCNRAQCLIEQWSEKQIDALTQETDATHYCKNKATLTCLEKLKAENQAGKLGNKT